MKDKITDTWTFKLNTVFQIGFSSLVEESFCSVSRNIPHTTGSALCDAIVDTFIQLSCRGLAYFVPLDQEKLLNNLKKDFMVKRALYDRRWIVFEVWKLHGRRECCSINS